MKRDLLNQIIISENTSIKDSLQILNNTAIQILLVVDQKEKLVGTLSDGDFRRSFLQNISLR